jgi:hypothetical protein
VYVGTAATDAGAVVRLGIYTSRADGMPGSLVLDAGTISILTTGHKEIVINQSLPEGKYILVMVCQMPTSAGVNPQFYAISGGFPLATNPASNNHAIFWLYYGTAGALPPVLGLPSQSGGGAEAVPRINLRVASIP